MGRHAVGERSVDRRRHDRRADDGRLRLAAEGVDIARGELAGLEARARYHRGDGVEDVQLGLRHDLGRQLAVERLRYIFGERGGHRRDRLVLGLALLVGCRRLRGRRALALRGRDKRVGQQRRAAGIE
jgi:hypothetical protein